MKLSRLLLTMASKAYVGPLNGLTPAAAYSVRRLLTSYTGPLVTLRRASDNAELAFAPKPDGWLDDAAIAAWAGGDSFVAKWWDQSGNARHILQTAADQQPKYTAAQTGRSRPALVFDGLDDYMQVVSAINQPQHIFSYWKRITNVDGRYLWSGSASIEIGMLETATQIRMITGVAGTLVNYSAGTFRALTAYYNSADTSYLRINGTQTNNAGAVGDNANGITLCARGDETLFSNAAVPEWVLFGAKQSVAVEAAYEANITAAF